MRRRWALAVAGLALGWAACTSSSTPPGELVMGSYLLHAVPVEAQCGLPDMTVRLCPDAGAPEVGDAGDGGDAGDAGRDAGSVGDAGCVVQGAFDFEATFSRTPSTEAAWVTMSGISRAGAWDGQFFKSSAEARRVFPTLCAECLTSLEERMTLALLSHAQSLAAGNRCPANPLDGGVPLDVDAGVRPPTETLMGFDGVRACGELATRVLAHGLRDGGACAPECSACEVRYQVTGERR